MQAKDICNKDWMMETVAANKVIQRDASATKIEPMRV
jgi:hypothetical protein